MVSSDLEMAYYDVYGQNAVVEDSQDAEIDGSPAKEFEFKVRSNSRTLFYGKTVCAVKNNIAYVIYLTYGSGSYNYSAFETEFTQIIANFKFL